MSATAVPVTSHPGSSPSTSSELDPELERRLEAHLLIARKISR